MDKSAIPMKFYNAAMGEERTAETVGDLLELLNQLPEDLRLDVRSEVIVANILTDPVLLIEEYDD